MFSLTTNYLYYYLHFTYSNVLPNMITINNDFVKREKHVLQLNTISFITTISIQFFLNLHLKGENITYYTLQLLFSRNMKQSINVNAQDTTKKSYSFSSIFSSYH